MALTSNRRQQTDGVEQLSVLTNSNCIKPTKAADASSFSLKEESLSPTRPSKSPDLPEETEGATSFLGFEGLEGKEETADETEEPLILLSAEIQDEESKLEATNLEEEKKIRSHLEERAREEKELQEQRYKRLMHLLNKSQFYSEFLLQQIESQKALRKKSKSSSESEGVSSQSDVNSSQGSEGNDATNRKRKRGRGSQSSGQQRKKRNGNYKIADVIDTDTVKARVECGAYEDSGEAIEREKQPRLFENGVMRPYQLDGFSWLLALYENGINGILGDEMGLGKTIQCIALICHLVDQGVPGPFLVCGPLSTLPNWMSEFERFAPKVPTLLYHGPEAVRVEKRRQIKKKVQVDGCSIHVQPVVITSYEVAVKDTRVLQQFSWRYVCVDEGHRLKNYKCRLTKSLNSFPLTNRLLLTGTPLQNSLAELWALLNFLMPDIFDSLDVFESWFDVTEMLEEGSDQRIIQQEKENQIISTLMKILSPFFLRRVKKDVDLDIPPKRELLVYTPMTPLQVKLYEATLTMNYDVFNSMKKPLKQDKIEYDEKGRPKRKTRQPTNYSPFLLNGEDEEGEEGLESFLAACHRTQEKLPDEKVVSQTSSVRVKLQNKMMQCRRIVNHPYLIEYPLNPDGSYKVDNKLLEVCGKLQVLDQLLGELYHRGHRVLLFSQMTSMLDIVEDYLTLRPQYSYKRLDGSRNLEERQNDIKDFNQQGSQDFLFLLSTRAGGLGVNLASADTVIIYDSDWNPQSDLQAQDRCHRIGQTSPVLVLRLITTATIDERIVDRAATKRKLERLIIQSGKFKAANHGERTFQRMMDEGELLALLKTRDHDRTHRTNTGHIFSKKELDQLLDRSDLTRARVGEGKERLEGVFRVMPEED